MCSNQGVLRLFPPSVLNTASSYPLLFNSRWIESSVMPAGTLPANELHCSEIIATNVISLVNIFGSDLRNGRGTCSQDLQSGESLES